MARFYGGVQGNRGEATRLGSKGSGMTGFVQGWSSGVRVVATTDDNDNDVFYIYATGGSSPSHGSMLIGKIIEPQGGAPQRFIPA